MQIIRRAYAIKGPCYVRCGRSATPVLARKSSYSFREGRGEVRREGKDVTIVACGVMVHEADEAANLLKEKGISAAVVNMASIKPIDEALLKRLAKKTGAMVTAEEHNIVGGLGSAVAEVLSATAPVPVIRVGVDDRFGQSGDAYELLKHYGLTAANIAKQAQRAIKLKAG